MSLPNKYHYLLLEPGPKILKYALNLYGTKEIQGKDDNPIIMDWAKRVGIERTYTDDDIAWCSLFLMYVVSHTGKPIIGTNLMAQSWLRWGQEASRPELGDILVFWRGNKNSRFGHVAIYVGEDEKYYHVLGGNQDDQVNITRINKNRLLGARRFYNVKPINVRPIRLGASGPISINES